MSSKPNILVVMTDQQRFDTVAALGNNLIQTPVLDRLVREGTSFTSAYCPSPVCVSSRCSFVLGQYPHQTNCVTNEPMPEEGKSIMQYLNEAGYQTHGIGKMHFSPDSRRRWGYESRVYSEEGGGNDDFKEFLNDNDYDHIVAPQGERSEYYYLPQPSQLPERLHHTSWVSDKSIDFLKGRDTERPFFLWTSYIKPHPPFESPVPWYRLYRPVEMPLPFLPADYEQLHTWWHTHQNRYKYRDQGMDMNLLRTMRASYYACISMIDYHLGRILAHLDETGEIDNTLILYTSDHGEHLGDYNCYGKRSFLDVAARVPLLVRYPERFEAGKRHQSPVSLVDALPTFLSAAGLEKEAEHPGSDLASIANGESREGVLGQLGREGNGMYMLVDDDYKYIYSAADGAEYLFRKEEHRLEERNLAGHGAFNRILCDYRGRLLERFKADGYDAPIDGDNWREYPPPPPTSSNPDAGLLYQDARHQEVVEMFPEGYEPRIR
jgi:arylsulfatase